MAYQGLLSQQHKIVLFTYQRLTVNGVEKDKRPNQTKQQFIQVPTFYCDNDCQRFGKINAITFRFKRPL